MAKQWRCARCGTKNVETTLTCSSCRMIRGAVVVKTSQDPVPSWQPVDPPSSRHFDPSQPAAVLPPQAGSPIPTYWAQPDDDTRGRGRLRLLIPALFLVVGVVGAAIAVFSASPEAPEGVAANADYFGPDVQVGDCLDIANVTEEEVTGIAARPCDREHEYEVIFTGLSDGVGYPTETAFDEFFAANCLPAFEDYIGEPYEDSVLDIFWLIPTRQGWRQGDRRIQCLVYHPTVKRLTTSLKGAGRLRA